MFIRSVKVKGHTYIRLVESFRKDGKVKQRYIATICSQDTWDLNSPEAFVDQVADEIRDNTDIGEMAYGSKKQTVNVLRARAQDLLDEYDTRARNKQTSADIQAREPVLAARG